MGHCSLRRVVLPSRALQRCPGPLARHYSAKKPTNTTAARIADPGILVYTVAPQNSEDSIEDDEQVVEARAKTLESFIDEMNLEANVATARRFRGQDRIVFAELLGRLEDDPDNMYWLYHLAELYRSYGVNVKTTIPKPPPDAPPCMCFVVIVHAAEGGP